MVTWFSFLNIFIDIDGIDGTYFCCLYLKYPALSSQK